MAIDDDIALLEQVPTLSLLGRDALRVLAIGAESRTLQNGEVLFREGDPADGGYIVEEGTLRSIGGSQRRPVDLGRGALIGEMSLLVETRHPTTVTAAQPAAVMRISRALFLKMLQGYPQVATRLRTAFAERTQRLMSDLGGVRHALDVAEAAQAERDADAAKSEKP